MAIDIEKVLLARSARDAEEAPSTQAVAIGGAVAGATVGGLAGQGVHTVGRGINALRGKKPNVLKPGARMAGGLVGAILGGALGSGTRDMMVQNSPAAALLAKMQTGDMSESDMRQLQQVLKETYSDMGIG